MTNKPSKQQILQQQGQTRSRTETESHPGTSKKGLGWCGDCVAVFRDKHWIEDPALRANIEGDKSLKMICRPDEMRKTKTFEGLLTIDGVLDIKNPDDLMNLIVNLGEASKAKDYNDQILRIKQTKDTFRIETSDNRLATRMGNKIVDAFPDFTSETITPKRGSEDVVKIHLSNKKSS